MPEKNVFFSVDVFPKRWKQCKCKYYLHLNCFHYLLSSVNSENSVSIQNSLGTAPKAVRFLLPNTILDDKCVFDVREFEAPCVPNSPDVLGVLIVLYAHCTVNEVYQMYQTWQLLQLCQARSAQDSGTLFWKKSPHYLFGFREAPF